MAREVIEREKCTHIDLMEMDLKNIPKLLDEGQFRGNPYIVSEYIDWSIEDYLE